MITYLKVKNLAIVEEFSIEPGAGLNVLTGETGAGKSLLIDSLEFLSGDRGSTDSLRAGAERMSVEAVFAVPSEFMQSLAEHGVEAGDEEDQSDLIVRRELTAAGRGRAVVNGALLQLKGLLRITEGLLQIHGQSNSHERIAGRNARELLDDYARATPLRDSVKSLHALWRDRSAELERLTAAQEDRSLRLDLLRYQIEEISAAALAEGEEESLREERSFLANAQEIIEATSRASALLDEDENSAGSQISRAARLLQPLSSRVTALRESSQALEEARFTLQEISRTLASIASDTSQNPLRLEVVEERLALLERLKKKYGASIPQVLTHLQQVTDEHASLEDLESTLERVTSSETEAMLAFRRQAETLSKERQAAARKLQAEIQGELSDLAMEGTSVRIDVTVSGRTDSPFLVDGIPVAFGPDGFDRVEILVAPNRGEQLKPLQRIASGGELSRIQLAIAAAVFKENAERSPATLVFDEIDAGIGGRVAEVVGRKLRELGERSQVLCVTPLPQIACFGSTHFVVWKEESEGRTRAHIRPLASLEERVEEIARMLGGKSISETARSHARDLLAASERGAAVKGKRKLG